MCNSYIETHRLLILLFLKFVLQGITLRQDLRGSQRIIMGNQSLVLQSLGRNASGNYYCVATNSEGSTFSNAVRLDIKCKKTESVCIYFYTKNHNSTKANLLSNLN